MFVSCLISTERKPPKGLQNSCALHFQRRGECDISDWLRQYDLEPKLVVMLPAVFRWRACLHQKVATMTALYLLSDIILTTCQRGHKIASHGALLVFFSSAAVSGRRVLASSEPVPSGDQFKGLSPQVRQPFLHPRKHHHLYHHAARASIHRWQRGAGNYFTITTSRTFPVPFSDGQ